MRIIRFGTRVSTEQDLARLASQIARQCYEPVLCRVEGLAPAMSEPELRGYVRARAAAVVDRHVDLALGPGRYADRSVRSELAARVTELLVEAIAGKLALSRRRAAA